MVLRLAIRNAAQPLANCTHDRRNRGRGVALALTLAYIEGFSVEMVRGATALDLGQIKIQTHDYVERPSARHAFELDDKLGTLKAIPGVEAAAPRVRVFGLVGDENTSGVAPDRWRRPNALEPTVSVVADGSRKGVGLPRRAKMVHAKRWWVRDSPNTSTQRSATSWSCSSRPPMARSGTMPTVVGISGRHGKHGRGPHLSVYVNIA
ncbi:MAG: hypothetical protein R3E66_19940 [bacterium]